VLRACRRLLRRAGRIAFLTILVAPNLSPSQQRQAVQAGPPGVLSRHDHQSLLRTAGFGGIEETDLSADYLSCVRAWSAESAAREERLRAALGDTLFEDRQNDRRVQISAIERGLLRRSLCVARIER